MSRKTKKPKKMSDNSLLKIIRSSKEDKKLMIKRVMNILPDNEILKYSTQICGNPLTRSILLKNKRKFSDFYNSSNTLKFSLSKCLKWSEAIILNNVTQIEEYIRIEESITKKILLEDYNNANEELDLFIDKYGESLTLLQIKLHLILKIDGKNKAEKYISEKKENVNTALIGFIIQYQNQRLDTETTYSERTIELSKKFKEAFGNDLSLLSIVNYKILPLEHSLDIDLSSILKYEITSSVIDLYKAYCYLASLSEHRDNETKLSFLESTKFISNKIDDKVIKSISFSLGNLSLIDRMIDNKTMEYVDLYTNGEYLKTYNYYLNNKFLHDSFNAFDLFLKSLPRIDFNINPHIDGPISESIINNNLDTILKINDHNVLLNDSYQLSSLNWFFNQHVFSCVNGKRLKEDRFSALKKIYFSRSDIFSAFKCNNLGNTDTCKIIKQLEAYSPKSSSLLLYKIFTEKKDNSLKISNLNIAQERKIKYKALNLYNIDDYLGASEYFKEMYHSKDRISNIESRHGLSACLIETGNIVEASKIMSSTNIIDGIANITLPYDSLCLKIKNNITKFNSIYILVCLHLYYKHFGDKYFSALKLSFEMYILKNKIKKLEDIFEIEKDTDIKIISYFLIKIFVPNVMKGPLLYKNSIDVEKKRIEVCQFILSNKLGDGEKILDEIKERSKTIVLNDVKSHVDNNKIYVDVDYIREKIYDKCKNIYHKYIEQLKSQPNLNEDEIFLIHVIDGIDDDRRKNEKIKEINLYRLIRGVHLQNKVLSEKSKTFSLLMRTIRDEFTSGVKGLSGYLSTRIIHGVLETHYRKALLVENNTEITDDGLLKRSKNKEYIFNWSYQISLIDNDNANIVDRALDTFSKEFDKIINIVLDEWLNVKLHDLDFNLIKEVNKESTFNYCISNTTLMQLQRKISTEYTFEEVWDVIMDWLWLNTDQILYDTQSKIKDDLHSMFKKIFTELQQEIDSIKNKHGYKYNELTESIITSKVNIERRVNESIRWFTRNTDNIENKIDIELILDIVMTSLSIKSDINIEDDIKIDGYQVRYYVDILYILFSNALEHSNLPREKVSLKSIIKKSENSLIIELENNCTHVENIALENKKLEKYNDIYTSEKTLDRLVNVGETGYYKIQKTIKEDLNSKYDCKLHYISNERFSSFLEIINE